MHLGTALITHDKNSQRVKDDIMSSELNDDFVTGVPPGAPGTIDEVELLR